MEWIAVSEWFSQTSRTYPTKTAIEWADRGLSYSELEEEAAQVGAILSSQSGWAQEAVVAILTDSPFDLITSIIGILKAGGAFVPIDTTAPPSRIATLLEEALPSYILHSPRYADLALRLSTAVLSKPDTLCLSELEESLRGVTAADSQVAQQKPDAMCYLYFTSGSNGKPKAVAGRLKAIDHFVRWEIEKFAVGPDSRISQIANVAFDAYLKDAFVPLCAGATMCVPEDRAIVWQPEAFADWLDESRITHLHCVPSIFRSLLQAQLATDRFQSLQYVLLAGEPVLASDVDRWMEVFGERIRLVNLYGPSETTLIKLFHVVTPADRRARVVPIGRPMPDTAALIVDETSTPCPPRVVGEIWIRTPYRTHGYYRREDLTDEAFIVNPFTGDPNDFIYKTGDYGRIREDGEFEFSGRADGQVKINGARIELGEIEDVLRRSDLVRDAVVLPINKPTVSSLRAFVVMDDRGTVDELARHVSEWLPSYMIPADFVRLPELPKTATGKVDRKALLSIPEPTAISGGQKALTPLQRDIAGIWAAVLKKPDIQAGDNFFQIGGHSLTIFQVMSRIRQKFSVEMSVADMFVAPTLEMYSARVQQLLECDRQAMPDRYESAGFETYNGGGKKLPELTTVKQEE